MTTETPTFTFRPIGVVHSPYTTTKEIPKGLGAEHRAEGTPTAGRLAAAEGRAAGPPAVNTQS
jgi:hypothetical protein